MGNWKLVQGLNGVSSTCGWMFRHMKDLSSQGGRCVCKIQNPTNYGVLAEGIKAESVLRLAG